MERIGTSYTGLPICSKADKLPVTANRGEVRPLRNMTGTSGACPFRARQSCNFISLALPQNPTPMQGFRRPSECRKMDGILTNRYPYVSTSQMLSAKPRQPRGFYSVRHFLWHSKGQLKQSAICFAQPQNDISDTSQEALELRRLIRKRGQVACGALLISSISALAFMGKFPGSELNPLVFRQGNT